MGKRKRLLRLQKAAEAISPQRQMLRVLGAHLSAMEKAGISPSAYKGQILEGTKQKWLEMARDGKLDIEKELAGMQSIPDFLATFARAGIDMEDFRRVAQEVIGAEAVLGS